VKHIADFLDQHPDRQSNAYRSYLKDAFKCAVAKGRCKTNPVESTLTRRYKVERQRLKLEEFNQILEHASSYIQLAMRLGLVTLQRREDILDMQFKNIREGFLHVIQRKTEMHGKAAHLRIAMTPQFQDVVSDCRDRVLSRYLIHHRKNCGSAKAGDPLHPNSLSNGFAKAREYSGVFEGMAQGQRPIFHEIRALGAHLYREQGVDPGPLLGHCDAKTTAHYLDGHKTEWTEVSADLNIQFWEK